MPIPNFTRSITAPWRSITTDRKGKITTSYGESLANSISRKSTCYNTPNWKTAKKQIPLPNNPYFVETTEIIGSTGTYEVVDTNPLTGYRKVHFGNVQQTAVAASVSTSEVDGYSSAMAALDRRTIIALRNSMKDMRINVAQFIAERNQTINMIAQTAHDMAAAINALKKCDYVGAAKNLGVAASRKSRVSKKFKRQWEKDQARAIARGWLQLSYGWRPLIADAIGAAEALAKAAEQYMFDKISTRRSQTLSQTINTPLTSGWTGYNTEVRTMEISISYVLFYKVDMKLAGGMSSLGLTNPATIAWELMPWSFVIDWFVPIGNWIASLDAEAGTTFSTGTRSQKVVIRNEGERNGYFRSGTTTLQGSARASVVRKAYTRGLLYSTPVAYLPYMKDPRSTEHWLNAAALLTGAAGGLHRYTSKDLK